MKRLLLIAALISLGSQHTLANECPDRIDYNTGRYLKNGDTFYYGTGRHAKSGSNLYFTTGRYLANGSNVIYYPNGRHFRSGDNIYYDNGRYLRSGSAIYFRNGRHFKSGSNLYYANGRYMVSGNSIYYFNGRHLQSGESIYYPNGRYLKNGASWYWANGRHMKSGDNFYYETGRYARNGSRLYRDNGSTASSVTLRTPVGDQGQLTFDIYSSSEDLHLRIGSTDETAGGVVWFEYDPDIDEFDVKVGIEDSSTDYPIEINYVHDLETVLTKLTFDNGGHTVRIIESDAGEFKKVIRLPTGYQDETVVLTVLDDGNYTCTVEGEPGDHPQHFTINSPVADIDVSVNSGYDPRDVARALRQALESLE